MAGWEGGHHCTLWCENKLSAILYLQRTDNTWRHVTRKNKLMCPGLLAVPRVPPQGVGSEEKVHQPPSTQRRLHGGFGGSFRARWAGRVFRGLSWGNGFGSHPQKAEQVRGLVIL